MFKFRNNSYLYKKVFNLVSSNNNNVSKASNEISDILNTYGYRTTIIKTEYYENTKYSLCNLYGNNDIVINDCSSLSEEEIKKMINDIKNNNFYSWKPLQFSIETSTYIKPIKEDYLKYLLEDTHTKKEEIILQQL